jgi:ParB family chromosome partitioning protein
MSSLRGDKMSQIEIPIEKLFVGECNTRYRFGAGELTELAESIKKHGVIEPLIVRRVGEKAEVVSGLRRFEAAKMAGLKTVPCIVKQLDDVEATILSLMENLDREDLPDIAKARALKQLMDSGRFKTVRELAERLGKSPAWITQHLDMLKLEPTVESMVSRDTTEKVLSEITERHAREILSHPEPVQKELVKKVVESVEKAKEPPSVKTLREIAEKIPKAPTKEELSPEVKARIEAERKAEETRELFRRLEEWHNGEFIDLFDLCMPGEKKDLATWKEGIKLFEKLLTSFISEKKLVPELKEWCVKHAP